MSKQSYANPRQLRTLMLEYGVKFERLDEARVWKIFADLCNLSTCHFRLLQRTNLHVLIT